MDEKNKLKGMLGLACKAGSLIFGTELSLEAIKSGRSDSIFLACDASQNARRKINNAGAVYGADICHTGLTKEEIAQCIGKKKEISTVTVTNKNFTSALKALCEKISDEYTE